MSVENGHSDGTEYHYILTVQMPLTNGFETGDVWGTLILRPHNTRSEAFEYAMRQICEHNGWTRTPSVLFFALEPNQMPGSRDLT